MFQKENKITVFDLGSKYVKVLSGFAKDKEINIEFYEILSTPANAIIDGKIINKEKVIELLSSVKVKVKSKDIRIVLSSSEIILRIFELPKMELHEVREAIKFEMSVLLPESLENYIVDSSILEEYQVDNEDGSEITMLKVEGVAVERIIIDDYLECFAKAGHKIKYIDIESNCNMKLFCNDCGYISTKSGKFISDESLAIIDFGYEKISVTFVEKRSIFLHRTLNRGGKEFAKAFAKILELNFEEIEKKMEEDRFPFLQKSSKDEMELKLYEEFIKIFNDISLELYQLIEFFVSMSKQKKLEHILLLGGFSRIPEIDKLMEEYMNISTEVVDDFQNIKISLKSPDEIGVLANALGAFIRRG